MKTIPLSLIEDNEECVHWSNLNLFFKFYSELTQNIKCKSIEYSLKLNPLETKGISEVKCFGHFKYIENLNGLSKSPLILFIHGGPNTSITDKLTSLDLLFLGSGYNILEINYPGSLGYGQEYLRILNGRIGLLDVNSIGKFLQQVIIDFSEFIDEKNIIIYGGSHGGFISSWFTVHEEYSKLINIAIILCPVIDIPNFFGNSDIPEWGYEFTNEKFIKYPIDIPDMIAMYHASPIFRIKGKVHPKVLIFSGGMDKRVPSKGNAIQFYQTLLENGNTPEFRYYEKDGHAMDSIETTIDRLFNTLDFIDKKLN